MKDVAVKMLDMSVTVETCQFPIRPCAKLQPSTGDFFIHSTTAACNAFLLRGINNTAVEGKLSVSVSVKVRVRVSFGTGIGNDGRG